MRIKLVCLFILLAWFAGIHRSAAQGTTAFTYQGQLRDGGTNANGAYTMIFALYDAPTGGNQIGDAITNSPTLINGLFSVNLDFGANAFDGNARWLGITVTNGGTTETLSPRVQVLPSPYALYAANANNAMTAASLSSDGWSVGVGSYQSVSNVFLVYNNGSLVMGLSPSNGVVSAGLSIPRMQVFQTSGTFVVPPAEGRIMVEVWGGGGGGGGGGNGGTYTDGTFSGGNGGGGGGGGYGKGAISVTPGSTLTITVGTGGGGGGSGSNGGSGGTSSVADSSGVLISATGGQGGAAGGGSSLSGNGSGGVGGNPGTSSNAALFINGVQGGGGSNTIGGAPGGAGADGGAGGAGGLVGGFSGSIQNGQTPGGGGASGAGQSGTAGTSGNAGANGLVVIYY